MTNENTTPTMILTVDGKERARGPYALLGPVFAETISAGRVASLTAEPLPVPVAPAVVAPIALGRDTTPADGKTVSTVALARINRHEMMARAAGFALPAPIYAAGTRVVPMGEERFREERAAIASLPLYRDAAREVAARIDAEDRHDHTANARDLALTDVGLIVDGGRGVGDGNGAEVGTPTRDAWGQVCARLGIGTGAAYLRDHATAQIRTLAIDHAARQQPEDRAIKFRTRLDDDGSRTVFAAVSDRYTSHDANAVLMDAIPVLGDAHAAIVYDAERCDLRADCYWMPDAIVDLAAGDVFKAGVRITTSDDGGGSLRVQALLFRNRCLNLVIIGEGRVETVSARHIGSGAALRSAVRAGVEEARQAVAAFLADWGKARLISVDGGSEDEITRLAKALAEQGIVPKAWMQERDGSSGVLVPSLVRALRREPDDGSRAAVANALTRAAHEDAAIPMAIGTLLSSAAARYVRGGLAAI